MQYILFIKMQFRSLIFPAPNPPSYTHDKLLGELLYIPRHFSDKEKIRNSVISQSDAIS
jgi:hypothetical protein